MSSSLVVFDIDGVVADFEPRLVNALERQFGNYGTINRNKFRMEDRFPDRPDVVRFANSLIRDPNFYYGLPVISGVPEFINRLAMEKGVLFLSSRPIWTETFTRRWIYRNLGDSYQMACGVQDKAEMVSEFAGLVDFVVEDNPYQIEKLKDAGITTLCFGQEWNEGIFPRIYVRNDGEVMLWGREDVEAQPFFMEQDA